MAEDGKRKREEKQGREERKRVKREEKNEEDEKSKIEETDQVCFLIVFGWLVGWLLIFATDHC